MVHLRRCVYTTMFGGYERLNEQPMAAGSSVPFICLTDDPDLRSESWQLRLVSPLFGMDPIRSQRDYKIRPHVHLPDFDQSLYIDNSVHLTQPAERLFENFVPLSGICLPAHSYRDLVLDEFLEVSRLGYDDQNRIFEQLNHYVLDCPELLQEKPFWTAILLRDHHNQAVRNMAEIWIAHVFRYSRRDQLSANVAFHRAALIPDVLKIDAYSSWFHSWPRIEARDKDKGMRHAATSLSPPIAHIRRLEQALAEQQEKHSASLHDLERQKDQILVQREREDQIVLKTALEELERHHQTVLQAALDAQAQKHEAPLLNLAQQKDELLSAQPQSFEKFPNWPGKLVRLLISRVKEMGR